MYYSEPHTTEVLNQVRVNSGYQSLSPKDEKIQNIFPDIKLNIYSVLICQQLYSKHYLIYFINANRHPYSMCCNAQCYIQCFPQGYGKIICSNLKCNKPEIQSFAFENETIDDRQVESKLSRLIQTGFHVKMNLMQKRLELSKQIKIEKLYTEPNPTLGRKRAINHILLIMQTEEIDDFQTQVKQAEEGDPQAQFNLALMYEDGKGTKQDIHECIRWYIKAASNHQQASYNLASIYYLGRVVAPDYKIAYKYFNIAAELGSEQGMFQLGLMYLFGQGVEQDFEKCRNWFEKAAEQGSVSAMNNLGNIYRSGIGTNTDLQKAERYYTMAADKGDLGAMTNLATVLLQHQPEKAFDLYQRAARGGFEAAMYNLAVLLEEGTGTKRDNNEALRWYKLAAQSGNNDAKEAVQRLQQVNQQNTKTSSIAISLRKQGVLKIDPQEDFQFNDGNLENYAFLEQIGKGTFSEVYLGRTINNESVLLKNILNSKNKTIDKEIKLLHSLRGLPYIVQMVDYIRHEDGAVIVYKFDGCLTSLRTKSKYPPKTLKKYLYQLFFAINEAHQIGIMHRDIKPSNIIVCEDVTLIDWGLGAFYMGNQSKPIKMGTRVYKAPELLFKYPYYDYRIDIWAAGCVMAEYIFLQHPFLNGKDYEQQIKLIIDFLGHKDLVKYIKKYHLTVDFDISKFEGFERFEIVKLRNSKNRKYATDDAIDLLEKIFVYDHEQRITSAEVLKHPYFREFQK